MPRLIECFLVLVVVVTLVPGCEQIRKALYSPKIKVRCQVLQSRCKFTNYGDPGEACVTVEVFHLESGRTLLSEPVCSGHLERHEPVWSAVEFADGDPLELCMGKSLDGDFKKACTVTIIEEGAP